MKAVPGVLFFTGLYLCLTTSTLAKCYLGTAVATRSLNSDKTYLRLVKSSFGVVTPENAMKWGSLKPNLAGPYNFAEADAMIKFSKTNGLPVRGHALIWHRQMPSGIEQLDKTSLQTTTADHINAFMERYARDLMALDVCNEIIGDDGTLRQNIWLNKLGEGYIQSAFQAARSASKKYNSNVKLYLNDYSIEGVNKKSNKLLEVARNLKKLGIIDGVGFQAHLIVGQVPKDMKRNLERFTALGLEVAISELDIRMKVQGVSQTELRNSLKQQEKDYVQVLDICSKVKGCVGVSVWGVTDANSWIPQEFPGWGNGLLYDKDNQPKRSYQAIQKYL